MAIATEATRIGFGLYFEGEHPLKGAPMTGLVFDDGEYDENSVPFESPEAAREFVSLNGGLIPGATATIVEVLVVRGEEIVEGRP
jgi:hypothetical protein